MSGLYSPPIHGELTGHCYGDFLPAGFRHGFPGYSLLPFFHWVIVWLELKQSPRCLDQDMAYAPVAVFVDAALDAAPAA